MEWDPESKTVLYSLTWGDSTGLWTANYYFSFIYLPLIRSPHLKTFVNEISVRRFLPFTDGFFPLRVVSFCFHAPRDSPESRLLLYRSQLIKKLAHANSKVTLREMRVRKGRGGGVGSNAYFSRPTLLPRRPTTGSRTKDGRPRLLIRRSVEK